MNEIKKEILEASYWEHFNALKSLSLIYKHTHPKMVRLAAGLEQLRLELEAFK
jgi:hypothetical protein